MKRYGWLSLLLLTSLALGQAKPGASPAKTAPRSPAAAQQQPAPENEATPAAKVPASAAVITVQGLCPSQASGRSSAGTAKPAGKASAGNASGAGCKTVVTRAQFERLANALNPEMTPATKHQLAEAYPRLLLFAEKARQQGLTKDPRFQEMQRFLTLQLLAQTYTRELQKKAGDIPDSEIAKYYQDNPQRFEQVELLRIFVPKTKQEPESGSSAPAKTEAAADEAAMKATAEKIHAEAVAGGDFQKLQQEAFTAAGIKSQSPTVDLGKLTRAGLPVNHQKVFELQAGQVSELLDDPGGYYIYKVVSRQMAPLDQAKEQIRNFLQQQAFQKELEAMISSVKPELNPAYFGKTPPKAGRPAPGEPSKLPAAKPQMPPAQK